MGTAYLRNLQCRQHYFSVLCMEKERSDIVTLRLKAGGVEPKQTSIAEQRIGNYVPVTTNSSERVVAR
jgi:hypothetical protein